MALFTFSPSSATPGQKVTIIGTGFTGATAVKFGGVDALFFNIVDDNTIEAYPAYLGTGVITITTTSGDISQPGFSILLTRVKITDLPALGRAVLPDDLQYVFDSIRGILCNAPNSAFPAGSGGGSGGGTGNVFTALGSPFKVRTTDVTYDYDTDLKAVIIFDIRLLGKSDYVVSGSDVSNEFENFIPAAVDDLSTTSADDGIVVDQPAVNISGGGSGATFTIETVNNLVTKVIQTGLGSGYTIGDTFSIAALPGIIFTFNSITGDTGQLIYDSVNGGVTIIGYRLIPGRHITIYADGVVNNQFNDVAGQLAIYNQLLKPMLMRGGVVLPWKRPASEIPLGWQECVDLRGKIIIGQDQSDVYDATTNPEGLSQSIGTTLGAKSHTLTEDEIPQITIQAKTNPAGAGSFWPFRVGPGYQPVLEDQHTIGGGLSHSILNPVYIVQYIEYIGLGSAV